MVVNTEPVRKRNCSQFTKKNVLSLITGPPKLNPYWFCTYGGGWFDWPLASCVCFRKKSFEFNTLLRKNS